MCIQLITWHIHTRHIQKRHRVPNIPNCYITKPQQKLSRWRNVAHQKKNSKKKKKNGQEANKSTATPVYPLETFRGCAIFTDTTGKKEKKRKKTWICVGRYWLITQQIFFVVTKTKKSQKKIKKNSITN